MFCTRIRNTKSPTTHSHSIVSRDSSSLRLCRTSKKLLEAFEFKIEQEFTIKSVRPEAATTINYNCKRTRTIKETLLCRRRCILSVGAMGAAILSNPRRAQYSSDCATVVGYRCNPFIGVAHFSPYSVALGWLVGPDQSLLISYSKVVQSVQSRVILLVVFASFAMRNCHDPFELWRTAACHQPNSK